jgi:hypothetical protein
MCVCDAALQAATVTATQPEDWLPSSSNGRMDDQLNLCVLCVLGGGRGGVAFCCLELLFVVLVDSPKACTEMGPDIS